MYIDVQYVEWKRIHVPDADKEAVIETLKMSKRFTTAEAMFPDAVAEYIPDVVASELCINNSALVATVEVYDNEGVIIWDNVKLFPKPVKVITKHEMIDLSDKEELDEDTIKSIDVDINDLEPNNETSSIESIDTV
jgi:hypothetical protein